MTVAHEDLARAKRLLAGDEAAFRELFDSFFPKLYRFALARLAGNQDEAAEIVQQTFCKAFEHMDDYRGEASLYGWMCQICRNLLHDYARHLQREHRHVALLEDDPAVRGILDTLSGPISDEPDHVAARSDVRRLIQATLDRLPDRYGEVLEWKYIDGLTVKEIGERLTIGPKAAESLLTRARSAFRDAIATIGDASDVWRLPTGEAVRGP